MVFKKFVEIGRVIYIANGRDAGKIAAIVNVVDQNRLLIDGPCSGVKRQVINIKNVHLTKYKIVIGHSAKTYTVSKAWKTANISELWDKSAWAKKQILQARKASLTDFERFKARILKKKRNVIIDREVRKLAKQQDKKQLLRMMLTKGKKPAIRKIKRKKPQTKKVAEKSS